MGTFRVPFDLGDERGERWIQVEALVDTGSTYTWVPRDVLTELGVRPSERFPFLLADGRTIERDITVTSVRVNGRVRSTVVVFGDPGSAPLLGAVALEELALGIDPLKRRLVPVPGLAMRTQKKSLWLPCLCASRATCVSVAPKKRPRLPGALDIPSSQLPAPSSRS